jgi:hypothetical protein
MLKTTRILIAFRLLAQTLSVRLLTPGVSFVFKKNNNVLPGTENADKFATRPIGYVL